MTKLAAIVLGLHAFDKNKIHGMKMSLDTLDLWIKRQNSKFMGLLPILVCK